MPENKVNTLVTDSPQKAANILLGGGLVVFPTETVYGIGASALDVKACKKIYEVKNRPSDNPLILHVQNIFSLKTCGNVSEKADLVFQKFSPGPITGIFTKRNRELFTAGLNTVAVRIPSHPTAIQFLESCGVPVAAPSANLSGKPSLTKIEYILEEFTGKVDCILLGEEPKIGIESTVIDFTSEPPILVRPGFVDRKDLLLILPDLKGLELLNEAEGAPKSPGLKYRHYAPACKVVLKDSLNGISKNFGQIGFDIKNPSVYQIRISTNEEYMKSIYSFFVECDRRGIAEAWCETPKEGRGKEALINRISKAALK
ncbi:tRNA threonylcarbamoyl adenosine modification protein, Sua5/YciO/YrdC/YwlC family [Leptospira weilii serovar Ranarum str. ICFT]|uniref:Threonylcarbamoyl-AMP synthase n=1 Tax=Leptospira weilii serovar Ranarum str. ICFT TaxID=1218598 RepID=N1WF06_9LEPT|nr:L-threonylcarbamoyladenylate synthase [Leptospira weilii]EMY78831.1 tRNA threonylcarbamoyl adenosine modification protein, Sua5/YciO/YrdC/YwlC family [Leptospira weilii serovar Ranarum str. ICFT]